MPVGHGKKIQFDQSLFIGFLAEERHVEDIFCSPALNPFHLRMEAKKAVVEYGCTGSLNHD